MNTGLEYLQKLDFEKERFDLLRKEFKILYSYDGQICSTCSIIQGTVNTKLGIKKEYCDHFYRRVNKKIKKEKEKIMRKAVNFILPSMNKDNQQQL